MPCTPMPESASRTSSSLNGLMMAMTSFMRSPSEGLAHRQDERAAASVLGLGAERAVAVLRVREAIEAHVAAASALGAGVDVGKPEHPARDVLGDADLPVGVVALGEIGA